MIEPNVLERLDRAEGYAAKAREWQERADEVLSSICIAAMERGDVAYAQELIAKMPSGFYRTELRTYVNKQNGE